MDSIDIVPIDCTRDIAERGWDCAACGHRHTSRMFANICIGCPCQHTSAPVASAPKDETTESRFDRMRNAKGESLMDVAKRWDRENSSESSSSLPSARTVTRYTIWWPTSWEMPEGSKPQRPPPCGETVVYLASEIDPLLTALAAQDDEIAMWRTRALTVEAAIAEGNDQIDSEITALQAALAERAQEIERLYGYLDTKAALIHALDDQVNDLTTRAEAAEADRDKANARLDDVLNRNVPEDYRPVSFAALCDNIDSKQLSDDVYELLIWHLRHDDATTAKLQAAEAKLKERAG